MLGSYELREVNNLNGKNDQYNLAHEVLELVDLNGSAGNYIDEVSGKLRDLSAQVDADKPLRTISIDGIDRPSLIVTPLTELALRIVESLGHNFGDSAAIEFYEAFSSQLGIENIFEEDITFSNEKSVHDLAINSSEYNYSMILSAFSAFDNVTGSIDLTLDTLKTVFTEGPAEYSDLFEAAKQKVLYSTALSEYAKSGTVDMISKLHDVAESFVSESGSLTMNIDKIELFDDEISDEFIMFPDGSTVDFSFENSTIEEVEDKAEIVTTISEYSAVSEDFISLFQSFNQSSYEGEG